MICDQETIKKIRELAGLFLSPREIALLSGIGYELLLKEIHTHDSPVAHAYFMGKAESKYQLRKKVIKLAQMGAPQAQALAESFIEEQELDENE